MYAEFAGRVRAFRQSVLAYQAGVVRRRRNHFPPASNGGPLSTAPAATPSAATPGRTKSPLTARQLEIAHLIARGYTNQHIADVLVLTPGTVANHVQHIMERLALHSRTQIAVWFTKVDGRTGLATHDAARLELEPRQTA
jgi:DNA-binding NarL/FixJ family response regulator